MADISSILPVYRGEEQDDDQNDYESGEYSGYYEPSILDQVNPDDLLSPVDKMKKYCVSDNIFTRQMVARNVVETMQTVTKENDCHTVLQIILHLADDIEPSVRAELAEQLPSVCIVLSELPFGNDTIPKYILPIIVRCLTDQHNQVRKSSQSALLQLMEHGLITRDDVEKQVCPVLIQLTEPDSADDFRTEAVTLITRITTLVGADITERLFLKRFGDLCSDPLFHIRKECASNFGDIANVVGQEVTEKALLSLFAALCGDKVWGVRKSCAETFMAVSESCCKDTRYEMLAPLFVQLLSDNSRWVQMAAYQALGQFIATFADPGFTGFEVTEDGLEPCPKSLESSTESESQMHAEGTDEAESGNYENERLPSRKSSTPIPSTDSNDSTESSNEAAQTDSNQERSQDHVIGEFKDTKPEQAKTSANEKTESSEFNSFQFWKNPLPTLDDLSESIEGLREEPTIIHRPPPEVKITDVDRPDEVIYLAKQLSETFSDFDIEEEISLNSSEIYAENSPQDQSQTLSQNVVPPPLLDHYISMTEQTKAQTIDTELPRHCAYTFPGAVLALGKDNWHCLKETYELLASNMQWKVRRTLAFSIHDLALVLGEDITVTDLIPIFNGFLKDLDEVRIGVLKHLYDFIRLLPSDLQKDYLSNFAHFLSPDNNRNWRFRQELSEQLINLSQLYDFQEIIDYIFPIAISLSSDKVADVRSSAFRLLATILRLIRSSEEANQSYVNKFVTDVVNMSALRQTWVKRKACAQICHVLLEENAEEASQFATDFLPVILKLSTDMVPNVRIVAAKTLSKFTESEFFQSKTEDDQLYEVVMKDLERLRQDSDQDVRFFAGAKTFREVNLFNDDVFNERNSESAGGKSSDEDEEEMSHREFEASEEKTPISDDNRTGDSTGELDRHKETTDGNRQIEGTDGNRLNEETDGNAGETDENRTKDNTHEDEVTSSNPALDNVNEELQSLNLSNEPDSSETNEEKSGEGKSVPEGSTEVIVEEVINEIIQKMQTT